MGNLNKIAICPELGYIIGFALGDGCIYERNGACHLVVINKDKEVLKKFRDALKEVIINSYANFPIRRVLRGRKNYYCLDFGSSKVLYELLNNKDISLAIATRFYPLLFLKGFFDAEGSIYISKQSISATIECCNNDKLIMDTISQTLTQLGIENHLEHYSKKTKNGYSHRVRIYGWRAILKFYEQIGFTALRKHLKLKEIVDKIIWRQQELGRIDYFSNKLK